MNNIYDTIMMHIHSNKSENIKSIKTNIRAYTHNKLLVKDMYAFIKRSKAKSKKIKSKWFLNITQQGLNRYMKSRNLVKKTEVLQLGWYRALLYAKYYYRIN